MSVNKNTAHYLLVNSALTNVNKYTFDFNNILKLILTY